MRAFLIRVGGAVALDNGLGRLPPMGYNSWYDVECSANMTEATMRRVADKMVELGLPELGYKYLNLDDCWAKGRNDDGTAYADPAFAPSKGLKELADYVHSKGLLFGTYTDRGSKTCASRPGAQGYEEIDAKTYAEWGIDYLKEDSCFASTDHETAFGQYGKMRDALNATGRPIFFSLCGWEDWYAPKGASLGNAFRIGPDDMNWGRILKNLDIISDLAQYAGPGGWNDPCLLLSKKFDNSERLTETQSRAQFSLWAIVAAPLLISGNLFDMSPTTLATYTNKDVIGVNQDLLGKAGFRIQGDSLSGANVTNVWARPLANGDFALAFLNVGSETTDVTCGPDCFAKIGVQRDQTMSVRDLWAGTALPDVTNATMHASLEANGGHLMLRVSPKQVVV